MTAPRLAFPLLLLAPTLLSATQRERALRSAFEGSMVTVLMDLPGTEDGVDVYPGTSTPIDYPKYAQRLKTYGVALRSGQSVMVTKVKVPRPSARTGRRPARPGAGRPAQPGRGRGGLGTAAGKSPPPAS